MHSSQLDHVNGQHNTVVQGKYIAATSWLCVLLHNTTVDNVYIHLDIKLTCIEGKPRLTEGERWATNEMKWDFFHGNGCYAVLVLIG